MIRTLDETITFYKKKYELLKNYDNLKAEEYRELYNWLIDYKRLKAKEESEETQKEINTILEKRNQNHNRWDMIKETSKKLEDNSIEDIEKIKECIYKNR
ncbi:hypothetical protein [Brachyspira sp. G79]|uniref:hypothetical protein n=1 Tax=Brachyspira sp. G79 TaxID=1358104 RepID=UPI000BBCE741|nr:hypothetical protein [Brachyspira sp. G79]PCG20578.1 hypothetical protein KQ44_11660 [Brachyspira sp. G79]